MWLGFPATAACAPCIWHFSASFCGRCLYRLREISESRDETLPVPSNGHYIPIAEIQAFAVSCAASTRRVRHVLQPWDQKISKKYSTYPEMSSKLFRDNFDFQDGIRGCKREGPRNKPYFSFRNLNQIVSWITINEKYLHTKNWHDCDVRTPGCRTHARLATAPSPLLLSGGSGNKQRTTHSTAQLWSLPTSISV